jgi:FMN phosphatase YigB (HAD superfamily)
MDADASFDLTTPFGLMESGRRLRELAAIERRLFELVGQWVQIETNLTAKLQFGEQCYRHMQHSTLLESLLPTPAEQYPAAYRDAVDLELLRPIEAATTSSARLLSLYPDVLHELAARYQAHLRRTAAITDGPTIRALRLILSDLQSDRQRGQQLIATA